jgi:hypothetical protein
MGVLYGFLIIGGCFVASLLLLAITVSDCQRQKWWHVLKYKLLRIPYGYWENSADWGYGPIVLLPTGKLRLRQYKATDLWINITEYTLHNKRTILMAPLSKKYQEALDKIIKG